MGGNDGQNIEAEQWEMHEPRKVRTIFRIGGARRQCDDECACNMPMISIECTLTLITTTVIYISIIYYYSILCLIQCLRGQLNAGSTAEPLKIS